AALPTPAPVRRAGRRVVRARGPAPVPPAPGAGRAPAGGRRGGGGSRPVAGGGGGAPAAGRGRRRGGAAAAAVVLALAGLLGALGAKAERLIRYEHDALTVRPANVPSAEVLDELPRQTGAATPGQPH